MKTILITGATDGIGLETAQILAGLGHNLVIHGRNADKLKKTHKLLLEIAPNIEIDTYKADLSDFYQVAQLVDNIKKCHQPCLLYTSPSPRDRTRTRMPSSA